MPNALSSTCRTLPSNIILCSSVRMNLVHLCISSMMRSLVGSPPSTMLLHLTHNGDEAMISVFLSNTHNSLFYQGPLHRISLSSCPRTPGIKDLLHASSWSSPTKGS